MYRNALHPEDVSSLFDDRSSSVEAPSQSSQTPEGNAHIVLTIECLLVVNHSSL